jgi:hypothetical protein
VADFEHPLPESDKEYEKLNCHDFGSQIELIELCRPQRMELSPEIQSSTVVSLGKNIRSRLPFFSG